MEINKGKYEDLKTLALEDFCDLHFVFINDLSKKGSEISPKSLGSLKKIISRISSERSLKKQPDHFLQDFKNFMECSLNHFEKVL